MRKIKVCDAIMGSGKSSAAINYINDHPEKKFIYITPYLDETQRIKRACDKVQMYDPQKTSDNKGSKILHTLELIRNDLNVVTTHEAFRYYPRELTDLIHKKGYTLIVDENIEALSSIQSDPEDVQMAIDAGYICESKNGICHMVEDKYSGKTHKRFFRILRSRDVVRMSNAEGGSIFYWLLPPDLFLAFEEVYVLTYLFHGQGLYHMFEMHQMPYEHIYVKREADGKYVFTDNAEERYIPEHTRFLRDKLHLIENHKINNIGEGQFALSMNWFKKNPDGADRIKLNMENYFKNICPSVKKDRMWSTYVKEQSRLRGKGYTKQFLALNVRAINECADRTVLAYCVNLFMNRGQVLFFSKNGVKVDEELYAVSTMIQWIWRSAIRNGEEITLYLPSERMRMLLNDWLDQLEGGGEYEMPMVRRVYRPKGRKVR